MAVRKSVAPNDREPTGISERDPVEPSRDVDTELSYPKASNP
jgi:hypothetical protein